MIHCDEDETQHHLLLDCYRTKCGVFYRVWVFPVTSVNTSVIYGLILEDLPAEHKERFQLVIVVTSVKLWKTSSTTSIHHSAIDSDVVIKQILTDLRRRRTLDCGRSFPWSILNI